MLIKLDGIPVGFFSFLINCVQNCSFALLNLFFKIDIKMQLNGWIYRGVGSDENLN